MKGYNLFLFLFIYFVCSSFMEIIPFHIKGKEFEGYIFPKEYILNFSFENLNERYTPTKEEIIKAEKIIKGQISIINKSLINQTKDCPIIHKKLFKYKRQYVGYINNEGAHIIWINFLWSKNIPDNWNKDVIIILDGCSHYWNVKVNLNNNELFDLVVNGPA